MRSAHSIANALLATLAALTIFGAPGLLHAQTQPGRAEARAVRGQAVYSIGGGSPQPLKVGTVLLSTATVKTGPETTVDLFMGNSAGILRLNPNTTVTLERLALTDTGLDTVVEIQLDLQEGVILGNINKLSAASKYEIKLPNGIAGIRGTRFRCKSTGQIVLLDGSLIFVHVPAGGAPIPYTLTAPPAVEFAPIEGVTPASPNVVAEVGKELAATPPRAAAAPPGVVNPKALEPFVSPGK